MTSNQSLVVDMDSHVMEPPDLWVNYLEPKYRDRAIRIDRDKDGEEVLLVDNEVLLKGRLAALGGAEHDAVSTFTDTNLTTWMVVLKLLMTRMPASDC